MTTLLLALITLLALLFTVAPIITKALAGLTAATQILS